jgi:selenide, water dikinase
MQEIFRPSDYPDLLVGLSTPDDAAVWRVDDSRALVVTTDFFTPIVDDPYAYGAIAAANSLSDVYAMGGTPFLALNVAAFPEDLPSDMTAAIVRGGAEKAREAGVVIAGGHTVKDREPKYGLVAIGFADPRRMLHKGGLKDGDVLVLTKPLGFGLTTTALKRDQADPADVDEAIGWMSRLNAAASRLALEFHATGATDVTGFGLLGHAMEMADASGVRLEIDHRHLPVLQGTLKYATLKAFAGGLLDNEKYFGPRVEFAEGVDDPMRMVMFDPQTSGGLLLGISAGKADDFLRRAREVSQDAWIIGRVRAGSGIRVE